MTKDQAALQVAKDSEPDCDKLAALERDNLCTKALDLAKQTLSQFEEAR